MPDAYTPLNANDSDDCLADQESLIDDSLDGHGLPGVERIEAVTAAWTSRALIVAYVLIWLAQLVEGLLLATTAILTPYVTSAFAAHATTPAVGLLSGVVGGAANLALARVLDRAGRPQGLLWSVVLAAAGLAAMAGCGGVMSYAAAQVLQTIGNSGIQYSLGVLVADTSSLRSRGLVQAVAATTPNLVTCWLAGPLAAWLLRDGGPGGWRAGFAWAAVLVPATTLPLVVLLRWNYARAQKMGLAPEMEPWSTPSGSSALSSILHSLRIIDAVGLLLLSASLVLLLLPFHLPWYTPRVIGLLAGGCVLGFVFVVWESFVTPVGLVPASLLRNRTAFGACLLSAALFASFWCWNSFFGSYLQVVYGLDVAGASYVVQAYTVCTVVCGVAVGVLIHRSGRFRPACLWVGVPMSAAGCGMMWTLVFRGSDPLPYVVVCQLLLAVAAGVIMICDEVAILAAVAHQHAALGLAMLGMFGNIGGAVGLTVASAVWQHVFPQRLAVYLPADALPNLEEIYADLATQLSYPMGSATRMAIQHAYGDAQAWMLTAATAVWVVGLVGVLLWRDINVIGVQQSKGHVW